MRLTTLKLVDRIVALSSLQAYGAVNYHEHEDDKPVNGGDGIQALNVSLDEYPE